jgi:hypothetical protein
MPLIFVRHAVTDICAFAPRDYTLVKQRTSAYKHNKGDVPPDPCDGGGGWGRLISAADDRGTWYRRVENNGWRRVAPKVILEGDFFYSVPAEKTIPNFHYNRKVRQASRVVHRTQRKMEWMTKL